MKAIDRKYISVRIHVVGAFFCILFATIGLKAVHLQVFQKSMLCEKAAEQHEKYFTSAAKRGSIYDTNYNEMAVSIKASSIGAFPGQIKHPKAAAKKLAKILGVNQSRLVKKLKAKKNFVWIKRQISPQKANAVKKLKIEGVNVLSEFSRYYPNRTLASQTLGFSGIDSKGLEGIEYLYNSQLAGTSEKFKIIKDALGRGVQTMNIPSPEKRTNNLVLTIDKNIQYIAESALTDAARQFKAASGFAIVMNPKTGEILAIAHYPEFNPNSFRKFNQDAWRNKAITDSFEPGSTMKIFLAANALENNYCLPDSIFFCENGEYRIGKNIVHDTKPHEWMSLQHIIKYSSNIGAVKIVEMTGKKNLYDTLTQFGFGEKTGIDCPGETTGKLTNYRRWSKMDAGAISFGQGISVSGIQLITAVSAIANNGILNKPYIVRAMTDQEGNIIKKLHSKQGHRIISPKTAKSIAWMMHTVTQEGGTGINAAIENYKVCGKTGTAQKIIDGRYSDDKYTASFVGFAPLSDPKISTLVVIDEPEETHHGGAVAAPAFKKIVEDTLNYLAAKPKKQEIKRFTVDRG